MSDESRRTIDAEEHLASVFEKLPSNPGDAIESAHKVVSNFDRLTRRRQVAFVEALWKISKVSPADADQLFQQAILNASSNGNTSDLFTLGNYIFGPNLTQEGAIGVVPLPDGREAYEFAALRSGSSDKLASMYVGLVANKLLRSQVHANLDAHDLALAKQLEAWSSKGSAEHHAVILDLLTASDRSADGPASGAQETSNVTEFSDASAILEPELSSATDKGSKSQAIFSLCVLRIRQGNLSEAEGLLNDLSTELSQPLGNLREFKRISSQIESVNYSNLAGLIDNVAGLSDDLYRSIAALSLAVRIQSKQEFEIGSVSESNRDTANRALRLAIASSEGVPANMIPYLRLSVASVLVDSGRIGDAIRQLELSMQAFDGDQSSEHDEEYSVYFWPSIGGEFVAQISNRREGGAIFEIVPSNLLGYNYVRAVYGLALEPDTNLDHLDAMVSRASDLQLRILGLVAASAGIIERSFGGMQQTLSH